MKNEKTLRKEQLVKDLYWIEKKNKHNKVWDNNVKIAFEVSSSYSFEELVIKNTPAAEHLVVLFKQKNKVNKGLQQPFHKPETSKYPLRSSVRWNII